MISPEKIDQYRKDGYFILENALPPSRLRDIQGEAMRFKEIFDARMRAANVTVWDINHLDKRYFISLYHDHSEILKEYLFSEQMAEICRATVGPEVYLFQEQFVIKGAEVGMTFSWHQDGGWFAPDCPPYVSVWLALDDMTKENGTIDVLPQSRMEHRGWLKHRVDPKTNDRIGYEGDDPGDPVFVPPAAWPCSPTRRCTAAARTRRGTCGASTLPSSRAPPSSTGTTCTPITRRKAPGPTTLRSLPAGSSGTGRSIGRTPGRCGIPWRSRHP